MYYKYYLTWPSARFLEIFYLGKFSIMYWSGKKYKPVLLDARVEQDEHLAKVNALLPRLIAF